MNRIWSATGLGIAVLGFASCIDTQPAQHTVGVEPNDLGIRTLQTERSADGSVLTLHALSAADAELASVQLTTGMISGLSQQLSGKDDVGSEIVVTAAGTSMRIVTRETVRFQLRPGAAESPITRFLGLSAVSAVLRQEANLSVIEQPTGEHAYATQSCPAGDVLASPVARQCCRDEAGTGQSLDNFQIGFRQHSPYGACTGENGEACSGTGCFFGPNGFARPYVYGPGDGYPLIYSSSGYGWCQGYWTSEDLRNVEFSDVNGSFPTGQACPGGDDSSGSWDF